MPHWPLGIKWSSSDHASTARPKECWSLAASGLAPGSCSEPSKRNGKIGLHSRPPSAKRAFITRWIGRVKPIKQVEEAPFPVRAKNRTSRYDGASRWRDVTLEGAPPLSRFVRQGGDFDFLTTQRSQSGPQSPRKGIREIYGPRSRPRPLRR